MRVRMLLLPLCTAIALSAAGCHHANPNLPPARMLAEPGPGVGGPGPGVMINGAPDALPDGPYGAGAPGATSQFAFVGPDGMAVYWDVSGVGGFDSEPLIAPGRQNFQQGALYRLKLTNVPGRPGVELYPTLEVGPATPRTDAYLQHNAIPVRFTEEDLDQVLAGNFVTKVIYLPDPEFQELALANVETLVSTRLDPGVDPIVEADRRGAILAIVRLGNKDLEVPGGSDSIGGGILPASHSQNMAQDVGGISGSPQGVPTSASRPAPMPPHLSGVSTPQWGMPMSGTPIGLPGPPHVPLGSPAGLQRHIIKNHTRVDMPKPVRRFKIDVRQRPGYSYPSPVSRVRISERTRANDRPNPVPRAGKSQWVR